MKGTFPRVTNPSAAHPEGCARLACIRPAASVRSEPGSNSQVEKHKCLSLTFKPMHIKWLFKPFIFCLSVLKVSKDTESRQTVKLTLHYQSKLLVAWYNRLIHRMNQTAHISLQCLKLSNNVGHKHPDRAISFTAQSAQNTSEFSINKLMSPLICRPTATDYRWWQTFYALQSNHATPFYDIS